MDAQASPPSARELLGSDPRIVRALVSYAKKRAGSTWRAQEVAQEAITRVLEGQGWHRWDPQRKSLLGHLSDVVRTALSNERRSAAANWVQPMAEEDADRQPDSKPSPEQQLGAMQELERKRRLAARVMKRVAADPIIPGLLEHEKAGVDRAPELAALLQCSEQAIQRARERLAYHRKEVLSEELREERKRMTSQDVAP